MPKRPARAGPWVSIPRYSHLRPNPAEPGTHAERQPFCYVLRRNHQRDNAHNHNHERSTVAGHHPNHLDLRSRNSQRDRENSERNHGRSRLLKRRNQPCPDLDDHVTRLTGDRIPVHARCRNTRKIGSAAEAVSVASTCGVLLWNRRLSIAVELDLIGFDIGVVAIDKVSRRTHGWPANPESSAARERRIGVQSSGARLRYQHERNLKKR